MTGLVQQGAVPQDAFSICGHKEAPVLILGGSDPRLYGGEGNLQRTNMVDPFEYYTVAIQGFKAGDDALPSADNLKGYVDTGTSGQSVIGWFWDG